MKLHTSITSPFGRKCRMVAQLAGVSDRLDVVEADYKSAAFARLNPLGKVPALELDDGSILIDSPVIAAYLASLGDGAKIYPQDADTKWRTLHLEALADGVADAAVLAYLEERRPDGERSQGWLDKQFGKMNAGLGALESLAGGFKDRTDIGVLAVAAGLGWIELRSVGGDWRAARPNLSAWMDTFAQSACWKATDSG